VLDINIEGVYHSCLHEELVTPERCRKIYYDVSYMRIVYGVTSLGSV
jgi:hypothetical protein